MKITPENLQQHIHRDCQLRLKAAWFVQSEIRKVDNHRSRWGSDPDEDNVTITNDGVHHRYEVNRACHCHPEMEACIDTYPLKDFLAWLEQTDSTEIEEEQ